MLAALVSTESAIVNEMMHRIVILGGRERFGNVRDFLPGIAELMLSCCIPGRSENEVMVTPSAEQGKNTWVCVLSCTLFRHKDQVMGVPSGIVTAGVI